MWLRNDPQADIDVALQQDEQFRIHETQGAGALANFRIKESVSPYRWNTRDGKGKGLAVVFEYGNAFENVEYDIWVRTPTNLVFFRARCPADSAPIGTGRAFGSGYRHHCPIKSMALGAKLGQDRSLWVLTLFLFVGVLLPTGCVLWFMNAAAGSQAETARQSVAEAYRGQLRLVRDSLDGLWRARANAVPPPSGDWNPSDFPRVLDASGADSVILLDKTGASVRWPGGAPVFFSPNENAGWDHALFLERQRQFTEAAAEFGKLTVGSQAPNLASLAAQAQARCLVQSGQKQAALAVILDKFSSPSPQFDALGGFLPAEEQLLAVHLLKPSDPRFAACFGVARRG